MTTVFYPDLNDLCRRYLVVGAEVSAQEAATAPYRFKSIEASIFEHLLLFEKVSFKVHGENIPLAFLLNVFGEKHFEALVEQGALEFVLWTPTVVFMETEAPGIHPIASGNLNSPAHCDPEVSIDLGLNWMRNAPSERFRRRLIKNIAPLYLVPDTELAGRAVDITKSAYASNKLSSLGLSPLLPLETLPPDQRRVLCDCATELLEYTFLISHGMSSYSNLRYFDLFSASVRRIREAAVTNTKFNELAKLEGLPDLKTLYSQIGDGLNRLPKLRDTRSARKFREWMAATNGLEPNNEIVREYIAAIAGAKGLLDTTGGKFIKSVVMTTAGAGVGASIAASPEAALAGGLAGKLLEPAAELGLDLLDTFLLAGLLKGWTPRMFFDDLKRLSRN
jgi:hypothetical protein